MKTIGRIIQKPEDNFFYCQLYDMDTEEAYEFPISFPLLHTLHRTSQIYSYTSKTLYLCGAANRLAEDECDYSSSYLYSVSFIKEPVKVSVEVNSCYYHDSPALAFFKREVLIVVGGLDSKKCEYYSINNKKWKSLPELPEFRYGCSLFSDNNSSMVYLFGGYDKVNNIFLIINSLGK